MGQDYGHPPTIIHNTNQLSSIFIVLFQPSL
jgi:hypothetical protein